MSMLMVPSHAVIYRIRFSQASISCSERSEVQQVASLQQMHENLHEDLAQSSLSSFTVTDSYIYSIQYSKNSIPFSHLQDNYQNRLLLPCRSSQFSRLKTSMDSLKFCSAFQENQFHDQTLVAERYCSDHHLIQDQEETKVVPLASMMTTMLKRDGSLLHYGQISRGLRQGYGVSIFSIIQAFPIGYQIQHGYNYNKTNIEIRYEIYMSGFWMNDQEEGYIDQNHETQYQGQLYSGQEHGFGKMIKEDGLTYEGQWNRGENEGYGQAIFCGSKSDSSMRGPMLQLGSSIKAINQQQHRCEYKGSSKKGEFKSNDKLRTKEAFYMGEFKDHQMHGRGYLMTKSKIYIVNWQFGKISKAKVNLIKHPQNIRRLIRSKYFS